MSLNSEPFILQVSDFVALCNQTLEYAYPSVTIVGELTNLRISKNRWVYFDLKDEFASVKFFGTVYMLPGPLEDGLMIQVRGVPRLHPQYGFSINMQSMSLAGEGSIKRAMALLEAKLRAEGLFADDRKRSLPHPPRSIGLIASSESAAYHDFIKVLKERWGGLDIALADVQVQGEVASSQIVSAIKYFNQQANPPEVLVVTRGGGSADDLATFSNEQVTRAIAASRIPTLVAIGHEIDVSLAELAADQRASTPSNAAELLVPDRRQQLRQLGITQQSLHQSVVNLLQDAQNYIKQTSSQLNQNITQYALDQRQSIIAKRDLLIALGPASALRRGYAILRHGGKVIRSAKALKNGQQFTAELSDGELMARVVDSTLQ